MDIPSILTSIKKLLGLMEDYTEFDSDITMCINSAIGILTQCGVGPVEGFRVTSKDETWEQFIGNDPRFEMIRTYIFLKTKIIFDPPTSSAVLECYKEQIKEYEIRLNYLVDPENTFD